MKFRKKPVVIDAMRYEGNANFGDVAQWLRDGGAEWEEGIGGISIKTLDGRMLAGVGDWIIKGIKGEFYPCKPDIFAATYESVVE